MILMLTISSHLMSFLILMISKRALVFPGIPVLHALEIFQETKYGRRQKGRRPQICLLVVQISTDGKTHRMSSAVQYREFQGQKNPETPEAVGVQPTASKAFISFGADRQIRTADLILTKDALYRLSYISISVPQKGNYFTSTSWDC